MNYIGLAFFDLGSMYVYVYVPSDFILLKKFILKRNSFKEHFGILLDFL